MGTYLAFTKDRSGSKCKLVDFLMVREMVHKRRKGDHYKGHTFNVAHICHVKAFAIA